LATRTAISAAVWLLIIVFSPVILVVGEPVNRYVMWRVRSSAATATGVPVVVSHGEGSVYAVTPSRPSLPVFLLLSAIHNPLWIALTAPGRWVSDRFRRPPSPLTGS
jgi:hypothetical protein